MQPLAGKRERTRNSLISAVRAEIEDSGSFTAEVAARKAGSSPATFFNHFDSKDAAFDAAFESLLDELLAYADAGLKIDYVLEHGLPAFARAWVIGCARFFRNNHVLFGVAQSKLQSAAAIQRIYRRCETDTIACCARFIRLGQAANLFRRSDADSLARAMIIISQGYNNPATLTMAEDDSLHRELSRALVLLLAADPIHYSAELP